MGVTHWSSRRLADWLRRTRKINVSHDSISRLWRRFSLQPHRTEGFKFSTDPQLDAKVRDVVGSPCTLPRTPWSSASTRSPSARPWNAASRSCRCAPGSSSADPRLRPARGDLPVRRAEHRHRPGHRRLLPAPPAHQEMLKFLKKTAAACPAPSCTSSATTVRIVVVPPQAGPDPCDNWRVMPWCRSVGLDLRRCCAHRTGGTCPDRGLRLKAPSQF